MEDIYLRYEDNYDVKNLELFFEYQSIIRKDLERIRYLVSDYEPSEERTQLLFNVNNVIHNIGKNRFQDDPLMELDILIQGNYLVFSYFQLDEDLKPLTSQPTFVLITREMKNLYFINKVSTITKNKASNYEGLDNPYDDYCHYIVDCFQLEKDSIIQHNVTFNGNIPIYECFHETDKMVRKIKSKF